MPKLLLIEGLPEYDKVTEAKLIDETFSILKKGIDGRRARHVLTFFERPQTKEKFLSLLEDDYDYIHISAHGERLERGKGVIYVRNRGIVRAENIHELNIKAKVVFANACETYQKDLIDAFLASGNPKSRTYIAPKNTVYFDEAYLIALLFWKCLMLDQKTPWQSLAHLCLQAAGIQGELLV